MIPKNTGYFDPIVNGAEVWIIFGRLIVLTVTIQVSLALAVSGTVTLTLKCPISSVFPVSTGVCFPLTSPIHTCTSALGGNPLTSTSIF